MPMDTALFIIGFLCIAAIPVLIAVIVLKKTRGEGVSLMIPGIFLLLIFAVCAFVLGSMLKAAGA